MILTPLALSPLLALAQGAVPERISLNPSAQVAEITGQSEVAGSAIGYVWAGGRRLGEAATAWTIAAPGAAPQPLLLESLDALQPQLQRVRDLGNGRALLEASPALGSLELYSSDGSQAGTLALDVELAGDVAIANGRAYFAGRRPATGVELYVTDGTTAGTQLLLELNPGPGDADLGDLAVVNGRLVWDDGTNGIEVCSIPLTGGAVQCLVSSNLPGNARFFGSAGGLVFNYAADTSTGEELYVTDGTPAGTVLLADLNQDPAGYPANSSSPQFLAGDGAKVWFTAITPAAGRELWRTDGSAAGTQFVVDLEPGPAAPIWVAQGLFGESFAAPLRGGLVFRAGTFSGGSQAWYSDGTASGTVQLTSYGVTEGSIEEVTPFGSRVAFTASTSAQGVELWTTDGTPAGTGLALDLFPGSAGSSPRGLVARAGSLYFAASLSPSSGATSGVQGREPGAYSPTAGAFLVSEIADEPAEGSSLPAGLRSEAGIGYFFATDSVGQALYRTDGSDAGTIEIARTQGGAPIGMLDGRLVLRNFGSVGGFEPYIVNLAGDGITQLADLTPGVGSSSFVNTSARLGDRLYFRAATPATGLELHSTDGTPEGTRLEFEQTAGPASSWAALEMLDDQLFLISTTTVDGVRRAYVSDGSAAGTQVFGQAAFGDRNVRRLVENGGRLYLLVDDINPFTRTVWSTSGSEADLVAEIAIDNFAQFAPVNGRIVAEAGDQLIGVQPDGSQVVLLDDLNLDDAFALRSRHHVYFERVGVSQAVDGLWASDGTQAGTQRIAEFIDFLGSPFPFAEVPELSAVGAGAEVLFGSGTAATGIEPWLSDGTAAGTGPLADIAGGSASSSPEVLGRVGDRYLVSAFEPATGIELYSYTLPELGAYAAAAYGQGCGSAAIPDLGVDGAVRLGESVTLEVADVAAGVPVLLYAATSPAFLDLGACSLYLGGLMSLGVGTSNGVGEAAFGFQLTTAPEAVGRELYLQAAAVSVGAPALGLLELTGGLEIVVGQ